VSGLLPPLATNHHQYKIRVTYLHDLIFQTQSLILILISAPSYTSG
jgi:hypothetical protein